MSKTKKGSVLVYSLIILSIMLLIAITMSATATLDLKSSMATQKSTQAFQTADSTAEGIFQKIKDRDGSVTEIEDLVNNPPDCEDGKLTIVTDRGNAEISFIGKDGNPMTECSGLITNIGRIKSVGTFSGTARAVEMNINNL